MAATFTAEVLSDGAIRIDFGDMSGPHHCDAEDFLAMVTMLQGGKVESKSKRVGLKLQPKVAAKNQLKH